MSVLDFIIDNFEYDKYMIQNYRTLNKISLPIYRRKFPYNILISALPTYKEVDMIISRKKFFGGDEYDESENEVERSKYYEADIIDIMLMD